MVRIIAILVFGIIMFGVSAAGSWFVQKQMHPPSPETTAQTEKPPATEAEEPEEPPTPGGLTTGAVADRMPVAVRPREMSVEELLRYGMGIKEREEQVKQQEENLRQRQVQQQLALTDIESERREIDGLRVQVSDQLKEAEQLIEKLNAVRDQLKAEQTAASEKLQQIKHERIEIDNEHLDNTKQLSDWLKSMDETKAAAVLKSMANDGPEKTQIAVQILRNLEERDAAKILSAIDDTELVQQLIEQFRTLKTPPKSAPKR